MGVATPACTTAGLDRAWGERGSKRVIAVDLRRLRIRPRYRSWSCADPFRPHECGTSGSLTAQLHAEPLVATYGGWNGRVTGSMTSLRMAKLGFSCPFVIRL
jgi:hypothetical protein